MTERVQYWDCKDLLYSSMAAWLFFFLVFFKMKFGLKSFDADFTGNPLYNSCKKILDLPTTSVSQEYVGQGGRR